MNNENKKHEATVGLESSKPKKMPEEHATMPVWNSENWFYEDVIINHKIRSLRRTISEGEAMQFNCMVLDMHPYVGDEIFAKEEGLFGKRLVAGAMVFSYGLGLVATNCVNSFSYGYDKLRFIKPVFIGDTIYTIRTNMEKTPKYPEMGLVRTSYEVFKGEGEIVLYCEHLHSVKYHDPEKFRDQIQVNKK
jgi:acyl dehydratase|tara:strand:- start:1811 stop:2383 length:573 start_codon:yes stop_codon:yes gene_type:complete